MKNMIKFSILLIILALTNCKQEQKNNFSLKELQSLKFLEKHNQARIDSIKDHPKINIDNHYDIITKYPISRRFGVKSLNSGIDVMTKTELNTYVSDLENKKFNADYSLNSIEVQTNSSFALKKVLDNTNPDVSDLKLLILEQQKSHSQNYPVIIRALKIIKNSDQIFVNSYISSLKNDDLINQWMVKAYKALEEGKKNIDKVPQETRILATQNLEMASILVNKLEKFRALIFDLDNRVE
jgi:hypothetical protein